MLKFLGRRQNKVSTLEKSETKKSLRKILVIFLFVFCNNRYLISAISNFFISERNFLFFMAEQNLNSTLEEDSRTNLERRTDYTTNFGSKMQQRMLATDNTLRKDSKNNYVSELVLSRMSKNEKSENFQKFTTSEGESGTCPPRNINAKKVEQVYTFKELVSEEIMDGLSYHVEKCKEDDISYVSGYYGEIITNLNLTAFTADFILKGSHMTETERNYCYALCTLLVRLYKTFPMVNNRCKKLGLVGWFEF